MKHILFFSIFLSHYLIAQNILDKEPKASLTSVLFEKVAVKDLLLTGYVKKDLVTFINMLEPGLREVLLPSLMFPQEYDELDPKQGVNAGAKTSSWDHEAIATIINVITQLDGCLVTYTADKIYVHYGRNYSMTPQKYPVSVLVAVVLGKPDHKGVLTDEETRKKFPELINRFVKEGITPTAIREDTLTIEITAAPHVWKKLEQKIVVYLNELLDQGK